MGSDVQMDCQLALGLGAAELGLGGAGGLTPGGWPGWSVCSNRGLLGGGASEVHSSGPGRDRVGNERSRHSGGHAGGGGQLEAAETEVGEGLGRKPGRSPWKAPRPLAWSAVPVSSAHPEAEEQMGRKIQFDPVEWSLKCPWDAQTKSFLRSELTGESPGYPCEGRCSAELFVWMTFPAEPAFPLPLR